MRTTLKIVTALFLAFLLFGCGEEDGMQPENLLDQVGFEGTLPDGVNVTFESNFKAENDPIVFNFKTDADPQGNIFQGNVATHHLNIKDITRGFEIYLRLPELKWSEVATTEFNSKNVFEEIYSFDKVKEVLAVGEKNINIVDFGYEQEDQGAVPDFFQLYFLRQGQSNLFESGLYNPFFHEGKFEAPTDNFLRVVRQQEGTYINDKGETKRKLLVEFELNIQMYEKVSGEGYVVKDPIEGRLVMEFKEFIPAWAN